MTTSGLPTQGRHDEEDGRGAVGEERRPALEYKQHLQNESLTVVGLGASAGGLTALQAFFSALRDDLGMAYVVVTHMDPQRESLLPELLQRHTSMPVRQVREETLIEANHVYVIPPGQRIVVTDAHLDVEGFDQPRGKRTPIDHFFRSMANVHRNAVAIIFSGGGTDGSVGIKAIKEQGGVLMVQHPDEAEYDSMPRVAIATGLADVVLPAAELAEKLGQLATNGVRVPQNPEALTAEQVETVLRILTQVQVHTGHDFSQYKRSTILRRIQRRMQLHGLHTLDAYLGHLRHNAEEAHTLFNDLLIGVTNFFRDGESWDALAEHIIPRLFEGKQPEENVRVWSIGCSSGEEAYSLAILLLEYVATLELPQAGRPDIQVFASDLDGAALDKAREGLYPEVIEGDVSPERLERFFVKEGHFYRVKRELRDVVLFSSHNVLRDPPFSRLDLISCRNLLIYLQREMQQNVFHIFHYALDAEQYLFLGSSESAELVHTLFHTIDKQHRLYQSRPWRGEYPEIPRLPLNVRRPFGWQLPANFTEPRHLARETSIIPAALHLDVLEENAPASILVDEHRQILHLSESAGRYLLHPSGVVTADLLKLVRPELQLELRAALMQALEQNQRVVSRAIYVQFNGAPHRVIFAVRPYKAESTSPPADGEDRPLERLALIFFMEDETPAGDPESESPEASGTAALFDAQHDALVAGLEREVQEMRERLHVAMEEHESSIEELKAANEELQSINEEYRSTTEELETSKEELQSVNEELQTVNAELKNKLEEIFHAHSDLENLLVATNVATLFLDRDLLIQRYTPGIVRLFNIMAGDRGRPISHLTHRLQYVDLAADAARVLHDLLPLEREVQEVQHQDGKEARWFLAHMRPYRTLDDQVDGVIITFVNITELKRTTEDLRGEKEFSDKIVHTVREGMLVLKPDLTVEFANDSFYEMFSVKKNETVGQLIYHLGNNQWDIPKLRTLLEEILPTARVFNDYRVEYEFEQVGRRVMLLNARRLDHIERILLAIEDITEREHYEQELRESEARYRALAELNPDATLVHVNGRYIYANGAAVRLLRLEDAQALIGRTPFDLLDPSYHEQVRAKIGRIEQGDVLPPGEYRWWRLDGSPVDVEVAAGPIVWDDQPAVQVVARDITERKQNERALRELNEQLEERVEERTRQVRELAGRLAMVEHEERARIAQVLHDDLQQQLYSLKMQLTFLSDTITDEAILQEMHKMEAGLETAARTARGLSVELSPPILAGEGLTEAFRWLSRQMREQYQLKVQVEAQDSLVLPDLDRRVLLFQAVRELLFNVIKHAGVREATIHMQVVQEPEVGQAYRIEVSDQGAGFDPEVAVGSLESGNGWGLLHIRERISFIGGRLKIASEPGRGTTVTIIAPSLIHGRPAKPAGET